MALAKNTPNEYSLTSYATGSCTDSEGAKGELFDNNQAGDTKCHEVLPQLTGKEPKCIKVYSHNLCVYLYPKTGCGGQGSLASSQWGYCSSGNGTMFGESIKGSGDNWVPKSYMVNDGSYMAPGFALPPPFPAPFEGADDVGLKRRE